MTRAAGLRTAVLGLGGIGGSVAAALTDRGWAVTGFDPDATAGRYLLRRGRIPTVAPSAEAAMTGAALVVLAAPPRAILEMLPEIAGFAGSSTTVTDVASVKAAIARAGRAVLGDRFVPGHPVAGSERSGAVAADPALFREATWFLCGGGDRHRARVSRLIRAVGARPREIDPRIHDRDLAAVSHLPQLLASLLVAEIARRRPRALEATGSGFAGWARLAGSSPDLWAEILEENAHAVRNELDSLARALDTLRHRWDRDRDAPRSTLTRGRRGFQLWDETAGKTEPKR